MHFTFTIIPALETVLNLIKNTKINKQIPVIPAINYVTLAPAPNLIIVHHA